MKKIRRIIDPSPEATWVKFPWTTFLDFFIILRYSKRGTAVLKSSGMTQDGGYLRSNDCQLL